ncbi:hypothetical protein AB0M28_04305 [Streptomyces sp. NPDC051940]|uniref:hypothetical protein n=1 Tax=Streptomyces sp. NPDC051940 TaxID=3155675 RepID=UPI00342C3ACC
MDIMRVLDELPHTAGYDAEHFASERVQAAIVQLAGGSIHRLHEAVRQATTDWRGVKTLYADSTEETCLRAETEAPPQDPLPLSGERHEGSCNGSDSKR